MVLTRLNWVWFRLKTVVHILALTPLTFLLYRALNNQLGADPIATLTHQTGLWAMRFLWLSLSMTPLRKILKKPWPTRFRRVLGLYSFFYACLHFSVYLFLDLGTYWPQILTDIRKRPFITVGFSAWLLLIPLAITSNQWMMRKLKKNWQRLHRLVYVIAILVVIHFYWLVKSDVREPLMYAGILGLLFALRLKTRLHWHKH